MASIENKIPTPVTFRVKRGSSLPVPERTKQQGMTNVPRISVKSEIVTTVEEFHRIRNLTGDGDIVAQSGAGERTEENAGRPYSSSGCLGQHMEMTYWVKADAIIEAGEKIKRARMDNPKDPCLAEVSISCFGTTPTTACLETWCNKDGAMVHAGISCFTGEADFVRAVGLTKTAGKTTCCGGISADTVSTRCIQYFVIRGLNVNVPPEELTLTCSQIMLKDGRIWKMKSNPKKERRVAQSFWPLKAAEVYETLDPSAV
eukprot:scaffold135567_cov49-Attheya_sp.AAC.2